MRDALSVFLLLLAVATSVLIVVRGD